MQSFGKREKTKRKSEIFIVKHFHMREKSKVKLALQTLISIQKYLRAKIRKSERKKEKYICACGKCKRNSNTAQLKGI